MAEELSRTFNTEHGAIHLRLKGKMGVTCHTIYVRGVADVSKAIEEAHKAADEAADEIAEKFKSAGWNGNPPSDK